MQNNSASMKTRVIIPAFASLLLLAVLATGCAPKKGNPRTAGKEDSKTGVKYDEEYYKPIEVKNEDPAPGLVLIPGGTFMMGGGEKDIEYANSNRIRQVTVQTFYMDETEVANVHWKSFLNAVKNGKQGTEGGSFRYEDLYPDTTVWARDLAYNDPYVETYYAHPAFNMYPVVGIDWHQAQEYCKWRTKVVNSKLLEEDEAAILYPTYRLPTEAEWEYAARGLLESEVYAWEGKTLRDSKGRFMANFKRGRGDYAGWRGGDGKHMSDGYMITAPIKEYAPNDFGLYNMAGNVAEWTLDVYRVLAFEDNEDLNPYRRKGKTEIRPDDWLNDVGYKEKESLLYNPSNKAQAGNTPFDNVNVYRGGSWADLAYYLSPGTRRFYNADSSSAMIGFRCAMIKVGSPD